MEKLIELSGRSKNTVKSIVKELGLEDQIIKDPSVIDLIGNYIASKPSKKITNVMLSNVCGVKRNHIYKVLKSNPDIKGLIDDYNKSIKGV